MPGPGINNNQGWKYPRYSWTKRKCRGFPGSSMDKTLPSNAQGVGSISRRGTKIPNPASHRVWPKSKKKKLGLHLDHTSRKQIKTEPGFIRFTLGKMKLSLYPVLWFFFSPESPNPRIKFPSANGWILLCSLKKFPRTGCLDILLLLLLLLLSCFSRVRLCATP